MADQYEEAARKKALSAKYAEKIRLHEEKLKENLSKDQYAFLKNQVFVGNTVIYSALTNAMRKPEIVPSEYLSNRFGWLFDLAIPSRDKDVVLYFADRLREYPYSDSYMRRSFRSGSNGAYAAKLALIIQQYGATYMNIIDEPLDKILNKELSEDAQAYLNEYAWRGCGYSGWQVAYALDHHDSKIEDAVRRILTEENSSSMMSAALVRGVLLSHRSDFHELLGKLLLAARLQEGLRQVICENADYGTKDGFLAILKVIDENNLIRFTSVKRAVGTWLGILTEESRDLERVSQKSVRLILDCLENESAREECLASEDAMKIYIALWSYGLDDIDDAIQKIVDITDNGSVHQLLVSGYFAANIDLPNISNRIAKIVLNKHYDKENVLAVWLPCFMPYSMSAMHRAVTNKTPVEYKTWFDSKAEIHEHYQLFKKLYFDFSGKTKVFSPCVFPWYEAKISKSRIAGILCTLAAMSGENAKLDEACSLIKECNSDQRQFYFSALLREPKTALQRKTVLEGLVDRETYTRKSAYDIVSKMKLSGEEYRLIEEHLRFKSSDIRKYVMQTLLRRNDAELAVCIARLLENGKEEVRLGALDMLMQLKNDERRTGITDSFNNRLAERAKADNVTSKEKILIDSLVQKQNEAKEDDVALFSAEDKYLPSEFDEDYIELCAKTFAEYFPESKLPELIRGKKGGFNLFQKLRSVLTDNVACRTAIVAALDLTSLSKYIEEHKTESFVTSSGETLLLGNVGSPYYFVDKDGKLPLAELWKEWIKSNSITNQRIVSALVLYLAYKEKSRFSEESVNLIRTVFGTGFEYGRELPHSVVMGVILSHLITSLPSDISSRLASAIAIWFIRCVPDDVVMIYSPTNRELPVQFENAHLLAHKQLYLIYGWLKCKNDENLRHTFPLAVASAERCIEAYNKLPKEEAKAGYSHYYVLNSRSRVLQQPFGVMYSQIMQLVGVNAYLYAAYQGVITEAQLYEFLLAPENISDSMEIVTAVSATFFEKGKQITSHNTYSSLRNAHIVKAFLGKEDEPSPEDINLIEYVAHVYKTVIPVVLASELCRGDSPATYSKGIHAIARIYGAKYLSEILSAMGNDTLDRTAYYGWGASSTRKGSLSHLLSVCIRQTRIRLIRCARLLTARKLQQNV